MRVTVIWGPALFMVPTMAADKLTTKVSPRLAEAQVIGRRPSIHRLGPSNDEIVISSTFHPMHTSPQGLGMLAVLQQLADSMQPQVLLTLAQSSARAGGLWIATNVSNAEEMPHPNGVAQICKATVTFKRDGGENFTGFNLNLGF